MIQGKDQRSWMKIKKRSWRKDRRLVERKTDPGNKWLAEIGILSLPPESSR